MVSSSSSSIFGCLVFSVRRSGTQPRASSKAPICLRELNLMPGNCCCSCAASAARRSAHCWCSSAAATASKGAPAAVISSQIARGAVLELDGPLAVAVRLQEAPQHLADRDVTDAALLHLRRPMRPVGDVGADLRNAEALAPGLKAVAAAQLAELRVAHGRGLVVEIGEVRQDQPAGDQRINDGAIRPWRPAVQAAQQRQIVADDVVAGQIVGARQMLERGGVSAPGRIHRPDRCRDRRRRCNAPWSRAPTARWPPYRMPAEIVFLRGGAAPISFADHLTDGFALVAGLHFSLGHVDTGERCVVKTTVGQLRRLNELFDQKANRSLDETAQKLEAAAMRLELVSLTIPPATLALSADAPNVVPEPTKTNPQKREKPR